MKEAIKAQIKKLERKIIRHEAKDVIDDERGYQLRVGFQAFLESLLKEEESE